MSSSLLDKMPKELQGLQLLIEQFRDAEEWEERDEVLADIVAHEAPEAAQFLRLVAGNPAEDVYSRCDAACGLFIRTKGQEMAAQVLGYLRDSEAAYEFCVAADSVIAVGMSEAAPLLWDAWAHELQEDALFATANALENLVPEESAERFVTELEAIDSAEKLDFTRADLMVKTLASLKPKALAPRLLAWETKMRKLAEVDTAANIELVDIADLVHEAVVAFDQVDEE